jgi:hypothetical protein
LGGTKGQPHGQREDLTAGFVQNLVQPWITDLVVATPSSLMRPGVSDHSDGADCEDPEGKTANAFIVDKRCYCIILQVAFED